MNTLPKDHRTPHSELMRAHKYDEVIARARQELRGNPIHRDAIARLADGLRATGEYREAIQCLERLDALRSEDEAVRRATPGSPGSRLQIACLNWQSGDWSKAIEQMHDLVAGILNRSVNYAQDTWGMGQGLLLYYMAISALQADEVSYALKYLRKRAEYAKKLLGPSGATSWPCPVAWYLLDEVSFEFVIARAESNQGIRLNLPPEEAEARQGLARRGRVSFATFYRGARSRADGDEATCLACMQECHKCEGLSNEWYLAGVEILRSNRPV